jgi:hypothetical protein
MSKPVFTVDMTIENFIETVCEVAIWPEPERGNAAVSCLDVLARKLHSRDWDIVDVESGIAIKRFTELEVLIILLLKTEQVDEEKTFTLGQIFNALPSASDSQLLSTRSFAQAILNLEQAGMISIKVKGTASEKLVELVKPGQDAAGEIAKHQSLVRIGAST